MIVLVVISTCIQLLSSFTIAPDNVLYQIYAFFRRSNIIYNLFHTSLFINQIIAAVFRLSIFLI